MKEELEDEELVVALAHLEAMFILFLRFRGRAEQGGRLSAPDVVLVQDGYGEAARNRS